MRKPSNASVYIFSFALTVSAGVFAGQQGSTPNPAGQAPSSQPGSTPAHPDSSADSPKKGTSSRNRTGDVAGSSGMMVHAADQKFMTDAAKGGMMEVQLGQTAQQKASSDQVKELGKKIEQDHTQANKELADLAKSKNVSLPTDMGTEKSSSDKISAMSGAAFDKAYVKAMIRDHKKDIKEFERESTSGMDSDVKAFAAKTLPALREHLRMAEEADKGMGKGSSSSSSSPKPDTSAPKQ
jgi:putative membrane protein